MKFPAAATGLFDGDRHLSSNPCGGGAVSRPYNAESVGSNTAGPHATEATVPSLSLCAGRGDVMVVTRAF